MSDKFDQIAEGAEELDYQKESLIQMRDSILDIQKNIRIVKNGVIFFIVLNIFSIIVVLFQTFRSYFGF